MASDRSRELLSQKALPEIVIPKAAPHVKREFRLPTALAKGSSRHAIEPAPAPAVETAASPNATRPSRAPAKLGTTGDARAATAKLPESAASTADPPKAPGADAGRFRAQTLAWFDEGDDLEASGGGVPTAVVDELEDLTGDVELEPEPDTLDPKLRKTLPVRWIAIGAGAVVALVIALRLLS